MPSISTHSARFANPKASSTFPSPRLETCAAMSRPGVGKLSALDRLAARRAAAGEAPSRQPVNPPAKSSQPQPLRPAMARFREREASKQKALDDREKEKKLPSALARLAARRAAQAQAGPSIQPEPARQAKWCDQQTSTSAAWTKIQECLESRKTRLRLEDRLEKIRIQNGGPRRK